MCVYSAVVTENLENGFQSSGSPWLSRVLGSELPCVTLLDPAQLVLRDLSLSALSKAQRSSFLGICSDPGGTTASGGEQHHLSSSDCRRSFYGNSLTHGHQHSAFLGSGRAASPHVPAALRSASALWCERGKEDGGWREGGMEGGKEDGGREGRGGWYHV